MVQQEAGPYCRVFDRPRPIEQHAQDLHGRVREGEDCQGRPHIGQRRLNALALQPADKGLGARVGAEKGEERRGRDRPDDGGAD